AADGFAPRQDFDKAAAAAATARAKLAAAENTYEAAHLGPTREELAIADAKVENAAMSVRAIAAQVAKLTILAPAAGGIAATVVDPKTLCAATRPFDAAATISWIEGYDFLQQQACWVPSEIVHTDYTGEPDGYFLAGSNGLASGNHPIEAINAALYELIERDA